MLDELLREILETEGLTVYQAAKLISEASNEPLKTVHSRLTRWLTQSPELWLNVVQTLQTLGYSLRIEALSDGTEEYID
jgi:plasmid maintenance system antidote protein VapI